ncbi:MAG TPA: hypothetical protein VMW94_01800 [Actinomycetes bacterium]|nr:hypothetical protein [Actinomycetes bacterium]
MTLCLRQSLPVYVQPATATTFTCEVRENGAIVTPLVTGSSASIIDPAGTVLLAPASITVPATVATYSMANTVIPVLNVTYGAGYILRWTLAFTARATEVIDRTVIVVKVPPYCPISDIDLDYLHDGIGSYDPNTHAWQEKIEIAWEFGQSTLLSAGERVDQIKDLGHLKPWLSYMTLRLIAEDLASEEAGEGKWTRLSGRYSRFEREEWDRLGYAVDRNNDGVPDTTGATMSSPDVFLGGPRGRRW